MKPQQIAELKKVVTSFGGAMTTEGWLNGERSWNIDAPDYHLWKSEGVHCVVMREWKQFDDTDEYVDAMQRISGGVEAVTEDERMEG